MNTEVKCGCRLLYIFSVLLVFCRVSADAQTSQSWHFAASGDSRNCGDIVMPAIAAGVKRDDASFYWHLGDYRAFYMFDEDYIKIHPNSFITDYDANAWPDFIQHQLNPFGDAPVYLAIGNHELILPGTRPAYIAQFADWIDKPNLKAQRLADKTWFDQRFAAHQLTDRYNEHQAKAYYHWLDRGIDFITMDNASPDEFDIDQEQWVMGLLARDENDSNVRTVVVGMHATLPDSLSAGHSMNDSAQEQASGRRVYAALAAFRNKTKKNVYVIGSHSHFVMNNIYATACHAPQDVLPGWLVGTAGAVRYRLPVEHGAATVAMTDVYGYLLATVAPDDTISFEFRQVNESDIPPATVQEFTPAQVHWCFTENKSPFVVGGPTCPITSGAH